MKDGPNAGQGAARPRDGNENSLLSFAELREWGAQELQRRGGRRRSLPLLHGTLSFRRVPPTRRVADEAAALRRAREIGGVKVDAVDVLKQTGELLPGVERVPEREHFGIRFGVTAPEDDPPAS